VRSALCAWTLFFDQVQFCNAAISSQILFLGCKNFTANKCIQSVTIKHKISFNLTIHVFGKQMDKKTQKRKIWLYKDKQTGMSKGEATVTYDDANAAQSAISWFDGKEFGGTQIKVQLATKKDNWSSGRGGGGGGRGMGRGGGGGFGGPRGRDGGRFFTLDVNNTPFRPQSCY
jgi:hypothetical protein